MLKKLLLVAMVATTMLGGMAWGLDSTGTVYYGGDGYYNAADDWFGATPPNNDTVVNGSGTANFTPSAGVSDSNALGYLIVNTNDPNSTPIATALDSRLGLNTRLYDDKGVPITAPSGATPSTLVDLKVVGVNVTNGIVGIGFTPNGVDGLERPILDTPASTGFYYIGDASIATAVAGTGNDTNALIHISESADVLAKTLDVSGIDLATEFGQGVVRVDGILRVLASANPAAYTAQFGEGGRLLLTNDSQVFAAGGIDIGFGGTAAEVVVVGDTDVDGGSNGLRFSGDVSGQIVWGQNATNPGNHTLNVTGQGGTIVEMDSKWNFLLDNHWLRVQNSNGILNTTALDVNQGIVNMGYIYADGAAVPPIVQGYAPGQNTVIVSDLARIGSNYDLTGAPGIAGDVEAGINGTNLANYFGVFQADGTNNTFFEGGLNIYSDGLLTGTNGAVVRGLRNATDTTPLADLPILNLAGGMISADFYNQTEDGALGTKVLGIRDFQSINTLANSIIGGGEVVGSTIDASTITNNINHRVWINGDTKTPDNDVGDRYQVGTLNIRNNNTGVGIDDIGMYGITHGSWLEAFGPTTVGGSAANHEGVVSVNTQFRDEATFNTNGVLRSAVAVNDVPIADTVILGIRPDQDPAENGTLTNLVFQGGILDGEAGSGFDGDGDPIYGWNILNGRGDAPTTLANNRSNIIFRNQLADDPSQVLGNVNASAVNTVVEEFADVVFGGDVDASVNYSTYSWRQDGGTSLNTNGHGATVDVVNGAVFNGGHTNLNYNVLAGGMRLRNAWVDGGDHDVTGNESISGDTIYSADSLIVRDGNLTVNHRGQYNTPITTMTTGGITVTDGGSFNTVPLAATNNARNPVGWTIVNLNQENQRLLIDRCGTLNLRNDMVVRTNELSTDPTPTDVNQNFDPRLADGNVSINGLMDADVGATLFAGNVNFTPTGKLRLSEQFQTTHYDSNINTWDDYAQRVENAPDGTVVPPYSDITNRDLWLDEQIINANTIGISPTNYSNNADGNYYSLFGTYYLQHRPDYDMSEPLDNDDPILEPARQVLAVDGYRGLDLNNDEQFMTQLSNMGINTGNMNFQAIGDLRDYANKVIDKGGVSGPVELDDVSTLAPTLDPERVASYLRGSTGQPLPDDPDTPVTQADIDFADFVDQGSQVTGWGNNTSSLYNPLATNAYNLHVGMLGAIADGSNFYKVNMGDREISGTTDKSLLDYMNGASIGNVLMANWRTAMQHENLSLDRIYRLRSTQRGGGARVDECGMPVYTCGDYKGDFWVAGVGQWDNASESNGFDGYKYHSYGFATGFEYKFNDSALFGASFMYTKGDFEDKVVNWDNSRIHNYSGNVYLSAKSCSGVFGTLLLGYTNSDNRIDQGRGGNRAYEDYNTHTWNFLGQVGYDAMVGDNFMITPSIGVGYLNATAKGHNGLYADTDLFGFDDYKYDTFYIPLEVRANYNVCITSDQSLDIGAKAGIAYMTSGDAAKGVYHSYGLIDQTTGFNKAYNSVGRDYGHWNAMAGAGIQYNYKRMWVGVDYQWNAMKDFNSHDVNITAGIKF